MIAIKVRQWMFVIVLLSLATVSLAQEGLTIQSKGKQLPVAEAQKIYSSACAVVQLEFGVARPVTPRATLILGAGNNEVSIDERQIRLTKWDRGAFAQGAVMLAFENLMLDRRASMVKQTLNWADATVDAKQLAK